MLRSPGPGCRAQPWRCGLGPCSTAPRPRSAPPPPPSSAPPGRGSAPCRWRGSVQWGGRGEKWQQCLRGVHVDARTCGRMPYFLCAMGKTLRPRAERLTSLGCPAVPRCSDGPKRDVVEGRSTVYTQATQATNRKSDPRAYLGPALPDDVQGHVVLLVEEHGAELTVADLFNHVVDLENAGLWGGGNGSTGASYFRRMSRRGVAQEPKTCVSGANERCLVCSARRHGLLRHRYRHSSRGETQPKIAPRQHGRQYHVTIPLCTLRREALAVCSPPGRGWAVAHEPAFASREREPTWPMHFLRRNSLDSQAKGSSLLLPSRLP